MCAGSKSKELLRLFWLATFFIVLVTGHRITLLDVPAVADPRNNVTLLCHFDMEHDKLYSMKWYKDDREIFRYMPSQNPKQMTFPVSGMRHMTGECLLSTCSLYMFVLNSSATGVYRCEVSTEAPTFRIAHRNSSMTFAALPLKNPKLDGVPERVRPDDSIQINCTSPPSLPPAEITWYINGKKVSFLYLNTARLSEPDNLGLMSRTQGLQLTVQRAHFETADEAMILRCEAVLPQWLPISSSLLTRSTTAKILLHPAHAQLSKYTSGAFTRQHDSRITSVFATSSIYCLIVILLNYTLFT